MAYSSTAMAKMRTSLLPTAWLSMCFLIAPAFCFAQQQPVLPTTASASGDPNDQFAAIAGTVVSANTGEPLKKAYVTLSQEGSRGDDSNEHALAATTDAAGHFSIDKIPAGSYDLAVTRANYLRSRYGQDQFDKPGATPFRIVAPHEKRPARWVRMLKSITVVHPAV
jgi:hypothetical protein